MYSSNDNKFKLQILFYFLFSELTNVTNFNSNHLTLRLYKIILLNVINMFILLTLILNFTTLTAL